MIHLVTFSDDSMTRARDLCVESALRHGVDATVMSDVNDLPTPLIRVNERGCGYWAWKPLILLPLLEGHLTDRQFSHRNGRSPQDGDIVIYADAGIEFVNNLRYIVDRMDQDIFLFGNNYEHAHWCKRDVVEAVYSETYMHSKLNSFLDEKYRDTLVWQRFGKQAQASVIFFRVSDYSRRFVAEWLKWCTAENGRLIDDSPSIAPNHLEFREHRHDQAILTTMAYREGIKLHWWPAMYNDGAFTYEKLLEYQDDDYPVLFHHHRRRNHEWEQVA